MATSGRISTTLVLILLCAVVWPVFAAVTVDTTGSCANTTNTCNFSITISASSKLVFIYADTNSSGRSVSSVTVGASSATQSNHQSEVAGANGGVLDLWTLANPPTGAQTVTCTWNATTTSACAAVTFVGTDGTFGTPVTGTTASITVSSSAGNLVSDGIMSDPTATLTAGGAQTQQFGITQAGGNSLFGSTAAGAASVTMTWMGANAILHVGADVHASSSSPGLSPCRTSPCGSGTGA